MKTIVLQSFRTFDVPLWLVRCMSSVRQWASTNGWAYECRDDAFFQLAPDWVRERCAGNIYALTDVCRLELLLLHLNQGYERVIWADADILIFEPSRLSVTTRTQCAFAHELFLSINEDGTFTPVEGLNNAFMVFDRGQSVLDSYLGACMNQLRQLPPGPVPRTALGPALLAQLHERQPLELLYGVGLFTQAIMRQIAAGGGPLARECARRSPAPIGAANLCHFLRNSARLEHRPGFDAMYLEAVTRLMDTGGEVMLSGSAS